MAPMKQSELPKASSNELNKGGFSFHGPFNLEVKIMFGTVCNLDWYHMVTAHTGIFVVQLGTRLNTSRVREGSGGFVLGHKNAWNVPIQSSLK